MQCMFGGGWCEARFLLSSAPPIISRLLSLLSLVIRLLASTLLPVAALAVADLNESLVDAQARVHVSCMSQYRVLLQQILSQTGTEAALLSRCCDGF